MYHLFFATPEKILFDDEIESMTVPGAAGYFQILRNHAPILASLISGKLTITDKNKKKHSWVVSGGVFEFSNNRATLLGDALNLT